MRHTFKKALLSLAVIAVCSSLQFTSCKKKGNSNSTIPQSEIQALKDFYKATGGENWKKKWDTTQNDAVYWQDVAKVLIRYDEKNDAPVIVGIELDDNNLTGQIPVDILLKLKYLSYLSLPGNKLTGSIPATLGQLTSLTQLDISSNQLTGSIPATLGQLTSLTELNLASNQLTGSIPATLRQLTSLTELNLASNQLTGSIPATLGQLTSLTQLDISSNQLTGSIPATLGQLTSLTSLNLRFNYLVGPIPIEVKNMTLRYKAIESQYDTAGDGSQVIIK